MGEESRWNSAAGWDGLSWKERREKERQLEAERKVALERFREQEVANAAIEVKSLAEWASDFNEQLTVDNGESEDNGQLTIDNGGSAEPRELFPPFWYPGEMAVLMGVSGVDKWGLAMGIAAAAVGGGQEAVSSEAGASMVRTRVEAEERTTPSADKKHRHPPLLRKDGSRRIRTVIRWLKPTAMWEPDRRPVGKRMSVVHCRLSAVHYAPCCISISGGLGGSIGSGIRVGFRRSLRM